MFDFRSQAATLVKRMLLAALAIVALAFLLRAAAGPVFTEGALFVYDTGQAQWLRLQQTPGLLAVMQLVSALHGTLGVLALATLYAGWLWRRGLARWSVHVMLTMVGALLMNVAVKNVFGRIRPSFDGMTSSLHSFSFPSGHTVGATVFYGLVVMGVFGLTRRLPARIATVALAIAMVLWVASSRLYLGAHYVSDTGGGIVVGLAWLAWCLGPWPKQGAEPDTDRPAAQSAAPVRSLGS